MCAYLGFHFLYILNYVDRCHMLGLPYLPRPTYMMNLQKQDSFHLFSS